MTLKSNKEELDPLISIITSTYNAGGYIEDLIKSIRNQTYKNIEWVVIDGASSDETLDILRKNEDIINYWITEPDTGIYDAWNKAIKHVHGDWICFIGADDFFWGSDAIERAVNGLVSVPNNILVAYMQVMMVDKNKKEILTLGEPWEKAGKKFNDVVSIPHQGVFHRNELFKKHGVFNTDFRIAGDYDLLLRELRDGEAFFINGIVTGMRNMGISSQWENRMAIMKECRLAQKINGLIMPGKLWIIVCAYIYATIILQYIFGKNNTFRIIDFWYKIRGKPAYWTRQTNI